MTRQKWKELVSKRKCRNEVVELEKFLEKEYNNINLVEEFEKVLNGKEYPSQFINLVYALDKKEAYENDVMLMLYLVEGFLNSKKVTLTEKARVISLIFKLLPIHYHRR